MKRIFAHLLIVVLMLCCFTGCASEAQGEPQNEDNSSSVAVTSPSASNEPNEETLALDEAFKNATQGNLTLSEIRGTYHFIGENIYMNKQNYDMGTYNYDDDGTGRLHCFDPQCSDDIFADYNPETSSAVFEASMNMTVTFAKADDGNIYCHMSVTLSGNPYGEFNAIRCID